MNTNSTIRSLAARAVLVVATLIATAGVAVGVVQATSAGPAQGSGDEQTRKQAFVETVGANEGLDVARRKFDLFNKPAAKVTDGAARDTVTRRFPSEFALDDVRRADPRAGASIRVAAGRQVCLSVRADDGSGSDSCAPPAGPGADRPLVAVDGDPEGTRVTALVPNGIDELVVETATGTERLAVRDNIAAGMFPARSVRGFAYTSPSGERESVRVHP